VLLVAAWWAWPGTVPAPFELELLRSAVVDIALGAICFFLALLCCMRDARWFGSRWVACLAALLIVVYATERSAFWAAIAVCVAGVALAATAAWGTLVAAGGYKRQPTLARFATATMVGVGLLCAGTLAVTVAVLFWDASAVVYEDPPESVPLRADRRTTEYTVTSEGPVRVARIGDNIETVTDLAGGVLSTQRLTELVRPVRSQQLYPSAGRRRPEFDAGYRSSKGVYEALTFAPDSAPQRWYFLRDAKVVSVYNRATGDLAGWIGQNGWTASGESPPEGFSSQLVWHSRSVPAGSGSAGAEFDRLYGFRDAVYGVSSVNHTVRELFRATGGESVLAGGAGGAGEILVATQQALHIISRDGSQVRVNYPGETPNVITLYRTTAAATTDRYIRYATSDSLGSNANQLMKFSGDGTLLESYPATITEPRVAVRMRKLEGAMTTLAPPIMQIPVVQGRSLRQHLADPRPSPSWTLPVVIALSLASALVTVVLSRRNEFSHARTALWAGIAITLGPLAPMLMLALVEWPQREPCPNCGRQRVVTAAHCAHCRAPFAPPARNGTEILELALTQQPS
jgi:hypothetical protein